LRDTGFVRKIHIITEDRNFTQLTDDLTDIIDRRNTSSINGFPLCTMGTESIPPPPSLPKAMCPICKILFEDTEYTVHLQVVHQIFVCKRCDD